MKEKFSLKDALFNPKKIEKMAQEIEAVYPNFNKPEFIQKTLSRFPELELKARISWISKTLTHFLPSHYPEAITILLQALPEPCNPTLSDDDFGDFIYAPYAHFVSQNGCTEPYLEVSLAALKAITTRFSAEDAIRYFINAFPEKTLATLSNWTQDSHYHVRRLASEGTRPKLPWSPKINLSPEQAIPILDQLFFDSTRFVTRSVANHLNDISKTNPTLVLETLTRWKKSHQQTPKELEYMVRHSLRTLVKQGHAPALSFLNVSPSPQVKVSKFHIHTPKIAIGDAVEFSVTLSSAQSETLIIDYIVSFQTKTGGFSTKVFKLKQFECPQNETVLTKRHPFKANMTTRKLYPGTHKIELQINGKKMGAASFELHMLP